MTRTPNLSASRLFAGPGKKRALHQGLKEPFLSPGGSTHTTEALEKSKLGVRWLVLLLLSLLMIGNYYCYDNPAALYSQLAAEFAGTPHFDFYFDGLYSVYSLPNIVLPLAGGVIVDRWGVVRSLHLFTLLILLGQVVFAAACSAGSLQGMLLGRALFGLGGENLSVAQSAFVTEWFQTKELALALGVTLSVARFGSVLNNSASPALAAALGSVGGALWAGAAVCLLSMGCAVALGLLDAHHALGHLVDNRGGRATLCVASALLCVAVHLALGLTTLPASVLLLGLGLGYSVFAAVIWPSVAYVVDSKALGTAYGVVTALQNFGLFAIPLLVGGVHEATAQWRLLPASITPPQPWAGVELFFAALGGLGVVAGAALYADPRVRLALNSPTGRLPDGQRIFVQEGWERSPQPSPPPSADHRGRRASPLLVPDGPLER